MKEKSKLFVFDRIEVLIILFLMIVIAITSFTLGVKIGEDFSFQQSGLSKTDAEILKLKSMEEEEVDNINNTRADENVDVLRMSDDELKKKFEEIDSGEEKPGSIRRAQPAPAPQAQAARPEAKELINDLNNAHIGKWTIQLASYQSQDDADVFADGFRARGYNPIIHEAAIEGQGVWYRVSLGIFDAVSQAKEYISTESSLFQGQDYTIVKIQ